MKSAEELPSKIQQHPEDSLYNLPVLILYRVVFCGLLYLQTEQNQTISADFSELSNINLYHRRTMPLWLLWQIKQMPPDFDLLSMRELHNKKTHHTEHFWQPAASQKISLNQTLPSSCCFLQHS